MGLGQRKRENMGKKVNEEEARGRKRTKEDGGEEEEDRCYRCNRGYRNLKLET